MAQISRPVQLVFLGVVLLAGVWLFALHGRSQSSEPSTATSPSATPAAVAKSAGQENPAAPTPVYHGSAPGVAGLTGAIAKAHGAVASSQQNAKQLEEKSAQASGSARASAGPNAGSAPAASPAPASASHTASPTPAAVRHAAAPVVKAPAHTLNTVKAVKAPVVHKPSTTTSRAPRPSAPAGVQARQQLVESKLSSGDVALLLFWDRRGADDLAVQSAVRALARSEKKVFVAEAQASEVAAFGSITRGVQVYGTPTLLIVGRKGQTVVLTGLTDSYSIRQAISEARSS